MLGFLESVEGVIAFSFIFEKPHRDRSYFSLLISSTPTFLFSIMFFQVLLGVTSDCLVADLFVRHRFFSDHFQSFTL